MKLIKLTDDHYVVVDDSEIKDGDHYINIEPGNPFFGKIYKGMNRILKEGYSGNGYKNPDYFKTWMKKITHSTQPLEEGTTIHDVEHKRWVHVKYIDLHEVKELIGEVDVEKKAENYAKDGLVIDTPYANGLFYGYIKGYNQAIENNKEKKYTERDLWRAFDSGKAGKLAVEFYETLFQPKTEWEVEIIDGKLKMV